MKENSKSSVKISSTTHGKIITEYDKKGDKISSKIQFPSKNTIEISKQKTKIHIGSFDSQISKSSNGKKRHEEYVGKLKYIYETKNGKKDGLFETYHPNGTLFEKGCYKNGLPNGIFECYDEQGHLLNKKFYDNGQKIKSELYNLEGKKTKTTLYDSNETVKKNI